ncbi:MAG: glycosyltransferase family 2 protein [Planctomycetaceae bacterium]|nr:glycosyltransferase family 2 protein [Planctomycetaceae bacterium]
MPDICEQPKTDQNAKVMATTPPATDGNGLLPLISVVIPVRNEELHIVAVLDALLEQDYPVERFEVLVVDGHSTDNTREVVETYTKRFGNIRLFSNPRFLSSAARNIGIRESQGDIILIIDGHCLIDNPGMLSNVDHAMRKPGVFALGRPQPLFLENANLTQRAIALARHSRAGHHPDSFIYSDQPQIVPAISTAVAYRREVFDQIGLFDERFDACEDCELNFRFDQTGMICYFTPDIAVRYKPRSSIFGLCKQMFRYGRGRIRLAKIHPKSFSWTMCLPALLISGIVLGGVCATFSHSIAIAYFAVLACYSLIIGLESVRLSAVNRFLPGLVVFPLVFLAIHFAAGFGELLEIVTPLPRKPH